MIRRNEQGEAAGTTRRTARTYNNKGCGLMSWSKLSVDPELVELKGLMDLGFVFTEEDRNNSRLASIVPGIQRLGTEEEDDDQNDESDSDRAVKIHQRPYLWEGWKRMETGSVIRGKTCNEEMELKESLRWWAHAVASTARHCV